MGAIIARFAVVVALFAVFRRRAERGERYDPELGCDMNVPGFTAEHALHRPSSADLYRGCATVRAGGAVVPQVNRKFVCDYFSDRCTKGDEYGCVVWKKACHRIPGP
jgi:hypothetical protein